MHNSENIKILWKGKNNLKMKEILTEYETYIGKLKLYLGQLRHDTVIQWSCVLIICMLIRILDMFTTYMMYNLLFSCWVKLVSCALLVRYLPVIQI